MHSPEERKSVAAPVVKELEKIGTHPDDDELGGGCVCVWGVCVRVCVRVCAGGCVWEGR